MFGQSLRISNREETHELQTHGGKVEFEKLELVCGQSFLRLRSISTILNTEHQRMLLRLFKNLTPEVPDSE